MTMLPHTEIVYGTLLSLSIYVGYRLYARFIALPSTSRWALAVSPPVSLLVFSKYATTLLGLPWITWSGARLTPTFAMIHGLGLYSSPTDGPVTGFVYGPITAITYVPSMLASSPTGSILLAGLLSLAITLPPVAFTLWPSSPDLLQRVAAGTAFLFAAAISTSLPGLYIAITCDHADAPALGLGLIATALLVRAKGELSYRRVTAAASIAVLAVWAKQIEAPLILALATYLALTRGRRVALVFLLAAIAIGLALGGIFVAAFGLHNLIFNMFLIPALEPWIGPKLHSFFVVSRDLVFQAGTLFMIILAELFSQSWSNVRDFCRHNLWTAPALVALFMIPTSAMGRAKIGGTEASYHTHYYLLAACAMIFVQWLSGSSVSGTVQSAGARLLLLLTVLLTALNLISIGRFLQSGKVWETLWNNPAQQAFEYDRRHPGEIYFAWDSLSSFMAEGKLYHFAYGIFDRNLSGYHPSPMLISKYLPHRMRYLAVDPSEKDNRLVLDYVSAYSKPVQVPGLPGWPIYGLQGPDIPTTAKVGPNHN